MADRLELLELGDDVIYFDEPCPPRVAAQIDAAAHDYGPPVAEQRLLYAYFLAPEQLSVLVALYRYYFYQMCIRDRRRRGATRMALSRARSPPPCGKRTVANPTMRTRTSATD